MLPFPTGDSDYRILCIDPGSDRLGVALVIVDLVNWTATLENATTFIASQAIRHSPFVAETFGDRQARLNSHAHNLTRILRMTDPHCVISEAAYMGRFAQAFETLVECIYMLRDTVAQYDLSMCLETVDSPTAKNAVGAPGKKPKHMEPKEYKNTVRTGIMQTRLHVAPHIDFNQLDEHAIDAIAVGCYKVRCIDPNLI